MELVTALVDQSARFQKTNIMWQLRAWVEPGCTGYCFDLTLSKCRFFAFAQANQQFRSLRSLIEHREFSRSASIQIYLSSVVNNPRAFSLLLGSIAHGKAGN